MIELIAQKIIDPQFMVAVFAAIAAMATVLTIALPMVEGDQLQKRMKAVAIERERIRVRERDRLSGERVSLRTSPKAYMKSIVERYKLGDWLSTENAKLLLTQAGFRGPQAETAFLFFRFVCPIVSCVGVAAYLSLIDDFGLSRMNMAGASLAGLYAGMKAPEMYLQNAISKRQLSIRRNWPDALDLLLICVESGMSIEHAFRRVAQEVGSQSVELAEELTLTTAELSYLQDRRIAYDNLAKRTALETVKSVTTALNQAERYGTPLGTALKVLAQESRDSRMSEAEKKAAALPPKLTVPMIIFFLPVLFVVILMPAVIQSMGYR